MYNAFYFIATFRYTYKWFYMHLMDINSDYYPSKSLQKEINDGIVHPFTASKKKTVKNIKDLQACIEVSFRMYIRCVIIVYV